MEGSLLLIAVSAMAVDARRRDNLRHVHGTGLHHPDLRRIRGRRQALVALGRLLGGRSRVAMA
jgi:hypothetical protein